MASDDGGSGHDPPEAPKVPAPPRKRRGAPTLIGIAIARPEEEIARLEEAIAPPGPPASRTKSGTQPKPPEAQAAPPAEDPPANPATTAPAARPAPRVALRRPPPGSGFAPTAPLTARAVRRDFPAPKEALSAPSIGAPLAGPKATEKAPPAPRRPGAGTVEETVAALSMKDTMEAAPVPLALAETAVGPLPSAPDEPVEAPNDLETLAALDAAVDELAIDELSGEPTNITTSPESGEEEVPTDSYAAPAPLAEEPTRPRVEPVTFEPTDPLGADSAPPDEPRGEFTVGPTVVVDPAALREQQSASYRLDVDTGDVNIGSDPLPPTPTHVVARPTRSSGAMVALVVVGVIVVLGVIGVGAYFALRTPDADSIVVTEGNPAVRDREGTTGEPAPTAVTNQADPAVPTADPPATPDSDVGERQGAEGEGAEEGGPATEGAAEDAAPEADAPGEAESADEGEEDGSETLHTASGRVDIETLEGAEPDPPGLARRARRMPQAERARTAARLRGQALRAYRDADFPRAEALYREALTYNTWDVAAAEGVARSLAQQDRFPLALAWANLALSRNPRSTTAIRIVGDVYRAAGHPDRALRMYRRGLRRNPNDRWLRARVRELQR